MENKDYLPCYLCQKYKGTLTSKNGVPICPVCVEDLHQDAEKGEEFAKKEEKTPTIFKGSNVKLSINDKEIKGFKGIDWPKAVYTADTVIEDEPACWVNDKCCCEDGVDCECWADESSTTPSALYGDYRPISISPSPITMEAMSRICQDFEREFYSSMFHDPYLYRPGRNVLLTGLDDEPTKGDVISYNYKLTLPGSMKYYMMTYPIILGSDDETTK